MEQYLNCDSTKLWDIVLTGWKAPKATKDGVVTTLTRNEWSNKQKEENYKNKRL